MIKRHEIVNCENTESVTRMIFTPSLSQTVTLSQTPSPLERDILYGRPPDCDFHMYVCKALLVGFLRDIYFDEKMIVL